MDEALMAKDNASVGPGLSGIPPCPSIDVALPPGTTNQANPLQHPFTASSQTTLPAPRPRTVFGVSSFH